MSFSNYNENKIDEFWSNDVIIDDDCKNDYKKYKYSINSSFSDNDIFSENSSYLENYLSKKNHKIKEINSNQDLIKIKLLEKDISTEKIRTKSENDFLELELFESKIPKELSKEKKMSLLIVVLLQMIFDSNNSKLDKIFDFLNKKNILDLEVTKKKYLGIRQSLSMLIGSVNNLDKINNFNKTKEQENLDNNINNNINDDINNNNMINNLFNIENNPIQNYSNKYKTNFNEIKLLGQGSYGSVYKVFHKFEKKFYAIKKIFITKDLIDDNYNIFREIQIYSELYDSNIVRYYSSWVDIDLESIINYNNQINTDEFEPINYICPILFIQMELCDFTLKEYLLTYSSTDSIENKIDIILQIISGLEYLEKKNIIHRDIKPDNIFLLTDKNNPQKYIVKLGDFGLCKKYLDPKLLKLNSTDFDFNSIIKESTNKINIETKDNLNISNEFDEIKKLLDTRNIELIEDESDSNSNLIIEFNENQIKKYISLSTYVGTGIYKAPEIKTGNYDYKIDIYSLGIIILELFFDFKTQSEKIFTVSKIIKNENFINTNKIIGTEKIEIKKSIIDIIINCLNILPENRNSLELIKKSFEEIIYNKIQ